MQQCGAIVALLIMLGAPIAGHAAAASAVPFDHFTTGFELDGMHRNVECEACHVHGVFEGTPRACAGCHDGSNRIANSAKSPRHMMTTNFCEACHTPFTSWTTVALVDHEQVQGSCQSCHNGTYANPKPRTHPPTSDACGDCHNTYSWVTVAFDHTGIVDNCYSCHNGTTATGKSPKHIPTDNVCEACHSTLVWVPPTVVDHSHVLGSCSSCHDGVRATGKPPDHVPTTLECNACHSTVAWTPASPGSAGATMPKSTRERSPVGPVAPPAGRQAGALR